jgi:hypothetical protein
MSRDLDIWEDLQDLRGKVRQMEERIDTYMRNKLKITIGRFEDKHQKTFSVISPFNCDLWVGFAEGNPTVPLVWDTSGECITKEGAKFNLIRRIT